MKEKVMIVMRKFMKNMKKVKDQKNMFMLKKSLKRKNIEQKGKRKILMRKKKV